jgi:hypothetical protein
MAPSAAFTVFTTPSTFTAMMASCCARGSASPSGAAPPLVPPEIPAFAIARSTGVAASRSDTHASTARRSATSTIAASTSAPRALQSSATAARRIASRPQSDSTRPRRA